MRNRPVVRALLGVAAWMLAGSALADTDCRCRYGGQYFSAGQEACIVVDGRARQARCGKIQNNSAWKFISDGCPSADAAPASVRTAQAPTGGYFTPIQP